MSVLVMPTRTDLPHYSFSIELEGVTYGFEFRWNLRDSAWYFDISDSSGTPLITGRKVALGAPLLRRFVLPGLPPGELVAYDSSGKGQEAGIDELGARVLLLYWESSEFAAV